MKISVILPTYRPQSYIWECLDSLDSQTIPKESFEVIIILNGCNEPYRSQICTYIEQHPMLIIKLIQTDKGGVSNARNLGLDMACGDYITFIDDDDMISPSYLEELYNAASPNIVSVSNAFSFYESIVNKEEYYVTRAFKKIESKGIVSVNSARSFFAGPVYKLIHRTMIEDTEFNENFKNGEDSLYMFQISRNIKYVKATCSHAVYYRRIRPNSATTSNTIIQDRIRNSVNLIIEYIKTYFNNPTQYNFIFFSTRILASLRNIFE